MNRLIQTEEPLSTSPAQQTAAQEAEQQASTNLTSEEVMALVESLTVASRPRKTQLWLIPGLALGITLPLLWIFPSCYQVIFHHQVVHSLPPAIWGGLALQVALVITLLTAIKRMIPSSKPREALLEQLAASNDVRAIKGLWYGIAASDQRLQSIVHPAIVRLLDKVTEADAELFTAREQRSMCSLIRIGSGAMTQASGVPDLSNVAVAMVHALGQIGGKEALAELSRLEASHPITKQGRRMKAEAIAVLPVLRQRVEKMRPGAELLRASSAEADSSEALLRASSSAAASEDPAVLMRPSDAGDEPPNE
jgi:hypothetical protein